MNYYTMKIEDIVARNYTISNPDYKQFLDKALERQFFMKLIGFEITHVAGGYIEGELIIEEKHMQQHGFLHGVAFLKVGVLEFVKQTGHPAQSTNTHPGVGDVLRVLQIQKRPAQWQALGEADR